MKFLILALSLSLTNPALAKVETKTTENLKFVCNEGQSNQETFTLLQTIGTDSETGAYLFFSRSVDVQDCTTLPDNDPNFCYKLEKMVYHTWTSDQYVDGFDIVYTLAGTTTSDTISDTPDTPLFSQRIVTITDPDRKTQFYDLDQRFDPTKEQIGMKTTFNNDCRLISYKY